MEFLTLDFKGLEYGIQLKNKSNLRLLNCLKKNSKIIFYANTRFFRQNMPNSGTVVLVSFCVCI